MTGTAFDIRRVGGRIGAEVRGVDTAAELDDAITAELNAALLEHKALFFRGQQLDDAAHLRFVSRFGVPTGAHPTLPSVDGESRVLPVAGDEGVRSNAWHTDVTFLVTPPKITTLRAVVVPPYGGNTLISNTAAAYRDLPGPLRELADRVWAVHSNDFDYVQPQFLTEQAVESRRRFVSTKYQTGHPVVRVHPETGERALLLGQFAQRVVGLSGAESRDVIRLLQAYVIRPENHVRWQWAPGDLLLFDNRATQHYAPDDYGDLPRRLHRVTLAGDVPAGVDGGRSYIIEGDAAPHYTPAPV